MSANTADSPKKMETAIFAGGCFWCMEPAFENMEGVSLVRAGYAGGPANSKKPDYDEVSTGDTGFVESIKIVYDPSKVKYSQLLDIFWRQIDPTDAGGQFADRGSQYKTYIYYTTPEQKKEAERSKIALGKSGRFDKPIVTTIAVHTIFFDAEEYHQDYYKKNPNHYYMYKKGSGREGFIKVMWPEKK